MRLLEKLVEYSPQGPVSIVPSLNVPAENPIVLAGTLEMRQSGIGGENH